MKVRAAVAQQGGRQTQPGNHRSGRPARGRGAGRDQGQRNLSYRRMHPVGRNTAKVEAGERADWTERDPAPADHRRGTNSRGRSQSQPQLDGGKFGITDFVNPAEVQGDLIPYLVDLTKRGADYSFERMPLLHRTQRPHMHGLTSLRENTPLWTNRSN
jgi:hypothetical protein